MQTPTAPPRTKAEGFTLIELLIVILIITVLLALLMPAITQVKYSAWKTVAKNQCIQIATAITAYETEYSRLPNFTNATNLLTPNNLGMLLASDASNNPRGITFIETRTWALGKGGTNTNGFCDPFISTNPYKVVLDTNYSNILSNMPYQSTNGGTVSNTNTLSKHVAVWTIWTNGTNIYLINSWD